jgi:anaerobic dimethyl sulfoxide reductase subunit C (anchor subunit)
MKIHRWSFAEGPLVGFTAAAIAGVGVASSRPLAWMLGLPPSAPGRKAAMAVLLLVGGGLLCSVLHLGRPRRMTLAIRRTGRNALSNEVVLASITAAAALALAALPLRASWIQPLWGFASLAACGLLFSLASVYSIPAQLTWKGIPALAPLPPALLFGLTAHAAVAMAHTNPVLPFIIGLVVIDAVVWIARCLRVERVRCLGTAVHPEIMTGRGWVLGTRFALLTLLFPAAVITGAWFTALALLGLGILVDRFAFYGLAVRRTAESEIAQVETIIKSRVPV